MRLGIVIALDAEARTLARRDGVFLQHHSYEVQVAGPGPRHAERAARALLAAGCDGVLSYGLAGGLAPELRPGALLVASAIHTAVHDTLPCSTQLHDLMLARLGANHARSALLYGADAAIISHADKRALYETLGVAAVDMESAAIARVAREHDRAFGALRCVVDPCDFSLPQAALVGMAEDGGNRPLATAAALLRRPWELPDLIRLAVWYGGALRALRGAGALLCE